MYFLKILAFLLVYILNYVYLSCCNFKNDYTQQHYWYRTDEIQVPAGKRSCLTSTQTKLLSTFLALVLGHKHWPAGPASGSPKHPHHTQYLLQIKCWRDTTESLSQKERLPFSSTFTLYFMGLLTKTICLDKQDVHCLALRLGKQPSFIYQSLNETVMEGKWP